MARDLTESEGPDDATQAQAIMAQAIVEAAQGAVMLAGITAIGKNLRDWSKATSINVLALDDDSTAIMGKVAVAERMAAALATLDAAERASDLSDDQRATLATARPLSDALRGAATIDDAMPHFVRLETILSETGLSEMGLIAKGVHQHDTHHHDNLDNLWNAMAVRTTRHRMFVGRFLQATKAHDFIPNVGERKAHSDMQALIWRIRHAATPEEFERLLDQGERDLRALCRMAGIAEPSDPVIGDPEALTAMFHQMPDDTSDMAGQRDAVWHDRAKVLERHLDLSNRVRPALDQADYSDEAQRSIAADLRASMVRSASTSHLPTMEAAMREAERHLAHLLTGQDPENDDE